MERLANMRIQELRQSKDYADIINKIKKYPKDYTFTLNYSEIPKAKVNALRIIMEDCIKKGIVESIAIGLAINGEQTDETFERL